MPRHPNLAPTLTEIAAAVYSPLVERVRDHRGESYPFHVGDTWLEPAAGCHMEDLKTADYPGLHRYAPPRGIPALLEALAQRVTQRSGVTTTQEEVLISTGATGGLAAVAGALISPGDEVLILAPYWPLISGIVRCFHGIPVPVPLLGEVDSAEDAARAVSQRLTQRSVALYVSTPNNPSGQVLPAQWLTTLAEVARSADLWILSDDVYEDYVYEGTHCYLRAIAPERTFSAHSFSKAFGMAGNRCGYIVGPARTMGAIGKVSTHAYYSASTASQVAALRTLDGRGDAWIDAAREQYRRVGRDAAARLGVDPPAGSQFLFINLAGRLDDRGLGGFLEDCADRGILLAPGTSFGPYPHHVRLCYTSAAPEVVARGVELLAGLLGR